MTTQLQARPESLNTIEQWIGPIEADFSARLSSNDVNIASEAGFAVQILSANSFSMGVAQKNPQSLRDAVLNVAAIGISLNPAEKKAYLVPRGGAICLDISYRGLAQIAVDSGAAEWIEAKIVYAGDEYIPAGIGEKPKHTPANPFTGAKGQPIGVYAIAKRKDGSYAVRELDMARITSIRSRSESAKRGSGPWKTDEEEMILKTAVKAVVKSLQGTSKRIDAAIEMLNRDEGIDFNGEQKKTMRDINADAKIQAEVMRLVSDNGLQWEQFATANIASIIGRQVVDVSELTSLDAGKVIAMLEMRLSKLRQRQQEQAQ